MKLIKIFGIVAGIHAIALLMIFANPGCSSGKGQSEPAPASPAPDANKAPAPAPVITAAPDSAAPISPIVAAPPEAAPVSLAPAAPSGGAFYSPTRPGTPAAAALESQPVSDVTPATAYTVGRGDSLWSIAKRNHLRVSVLAAANHLRVGATLRPGQKLVIPQKAPPPEAEGAKAVPSSAGGGSTGLATTGPAAPVRSALKHVVRPGETLGSIARHYRVKLGDLSVANNISDPQKIRPGQTLIIPANGRAPAAKAAAPGPAEGPSAPAGPAPDQDLDAGLKTAPTNTLPVIKIEPDAGTAAPPKQP